MIVTEATLVGFTLINGTWGVQMALFIASLFNFFVNPDPDIPKPPYLTPSAFNDEMQALRNVRKFVIPISHGLLMIITFIT